MNRNTLQDQGFTLLQYGSTKPEGFDEAELFDDHIAPLVTTLAELCAKAGIPCYMVFSVGSDGRNADMRDSLVACGPERLTPPVLVAAATVRAASDEEVKAVMQTVQARALMAQSADEAMH